MLQHQLSSLVRSPRSSALRDHMDVEGFLNEELKAVVTTGLKRLIEERPRNPTQFLGDFLKKQSAEFQEERFVAEVGQSGLECTLRTTSQRAPRRGRSESGQMQNVSHLAPFPIFGAENPTLADLQKLLDAAEEQAPTKKPGGKIHLIVETVGVWEELVFLLGVPHSTDLPKRLEDARLAGKAAVPTEQEAFASLLQGLGRHRRPQSLADCYSALRTRNSKIVTTVLPKVDLDGTALHDALAAAIGLEDNLEFLSPIVVVSYKQPMHSRLRRVLALCVALYRPLDEFRVFNEVNAVDEASKVESGQKKFAFHEYQKYWTSVLDRRDKRDKQREQKDAERKQAIHEARVAAAKEAAAKEAAAKEAAAKEAATKEGIPVPPHPPTEPRRAGGRFGGKQAEEPPLVLPPLPPPDPAVVEARKRGIALRMHRRQEEDSQFVRIMAQTRVDCVKRIQRMFRNWRNRSKRAQLDKELRESETTGGAVSETAASYKEMNQEPPFSGPALIQKVWYRLKQVHGTLFSTLPPPPPVPPRRQHYFAPQRAPIEPTYEDDVSSEDERWVEHVLVIPDRSQKSRSVYFNPYIRMQKCYASAEYDGLALAEDMQVQFVGASNLQYAAYRRITESVLDMLFIAFVELSHRRSLPTSVKTFGEYVHSFHAEVFSWASAPHDVATTTSLSGTPTAIASGPLRPLNERRLYLSVDTPRNCWWSNLDTSTSSGTPRAAAAGNGNHVSFKYFARVSPYLYFANDALDRPKWHAVIQHAVDDHKHERILWISMTTDPYVYVNGQPFVLCRVPMKQIVDHAPLYYSIETEVHRRSITAGPTSSSGGGGNSSATASTATNASSTASGSAQASAGAAAATPARGSLLMVPRVAHGRPSAAAMTPPKESMLLSPDTNHLRGTSFELTTAQDVSFLQFGVSMLEWEAAVRSELLRVAEKHGYQVRYLAVAPNSATVDTATGEPSPALSPLAGQSFQSTGGATSHDVPEVVVGGASGGDAESDVGATPQHGAASGSPLHATTDTDFFSGGYFTDVLRAPEVCTKEWSILPKKFDETVPPTATGGVKADARDPGISGRHPSGNLSANFGAGDSILGLQGIKEAAAGVSNHHTNNAGAGLAVASGRSIRKGKALGSRANLESQSRRSFAGDGPIGTIAAEHEGAAGGAAGGQRESGESIPPVLTPYQESRTTNAQETVGKFSLDFQRFPIKMVAGPQFLLALDQFTALIFKTLLRKQCVVVATGDEANAFFCATAFLVEATIRSGLKSWHDSGIPVESSFEILTAGDEETFTPTHVSANDETPASTLSSIAPALNAFAAIATGSPSLGAACMNKVTNALLQCGLLRWYEMQILEHFRFTAAPQSEGWICYDDHRAAIRSSVVQLCRLHEQLAWLVLFQSFLSEFSDHVLSKIETGISSLAEVELPSFSAWVSQPRFEHAVSWMVSCDPWSFPGAQSPDRHHVMYSNQYLRWRDQPCIKKSL